MDRQIQDKDTITIKGILVPVSWNSSGQVICVAVSTFDEKEYRIEEHDMSNHWQELLNREISVQGHPYQRGMRQWITVESYHVIDPVSHTELDSVIPNSI